MGETSIEWCDFTFNPWIGCTKVSAGCANCYAEKDTYSRVSKSRGLPLWGPTAERHRTSKANWRRPLAWARQARWDCEVLAKPVRPRVFCASLADIFEDHPSLPEWRADLWRLIEACPELDWLLLTKRPENVLRMVPQEWACTKDRCSMCRKWPSHVFAGTSVEDQKAADERIPHLLRVPAPVRFLSCEPLLGPVHLEYEWLMGHGALQWAIVGGESGPKARPMHPDWARSLRDQCHAAGVPYFFNQWGEFVEVQCSPPMDGDMWSLGEGGTSFWKPGDKGARAGKWSKHADVLMRRIGKKAAGRLLDGRTWDEMPEVRR